jgi:hypothetical protein
LVDFSRRSGTALGDVLTLLPPLNSFLNLKFRYINSENIQALETVVAELARGKSGLEEVVKVVGKLHEGLSFAECPDIKRWAFVISSFQSLQHVQEGIHSLKGILER